MTYPQYEVAQPKVIIPEGVSSDIGVNPVEIAQTTHELRVSDIGTGETTVYVDPKNRLLFLGAHYTNKIGKLRFHSIPEIQDADGDIIRISTKVRGKLRSDEEMNGTLVHELEHRAQQERRDKKVDVGHLTIVGLATAGAVIGNKLGKGAKGRATKVAAPLLGLATGYFLGNLIAPHEVQARKRTREVKTDAIKRY